MIFSSNIAAGYLYFQAEAQQQAEQARATERLLRSKAQALRSQLKNQMKAKEKKRTRTARWLEECPGISGPSLSGRRIKPLPQHWPKAEKVTVTSDQAQVAPAMEEMTIKEESLNLKLKEEKDEAQAKLNITFREFSQEMQRKIDEGELELVAS